MLAVFDLDGTLLNGDSTALWLWRRVHRSPARLAAALVVTPLALPMVILPFTRRLGASIFLWIATVGLCETRLKESFRAFADEIRAGCEAGGSALDWRCGGLETLDAHLRGGDRVVIVTAAPVLLAQALIEPLGRPVAVLGTTLKRRGGGWVADVHCRNQQKCRALAEAGHGAHWAYAYTDSLDDLPMLRAADRPAIVKGGEAAARRLSRAGLSNGRSLAW